MKQRILSTLLALAMCLSLLPTAAFADGENDGSAETHTHCVCGAEHMVIGNHTTESKATFTA